MDQSLGTRLRFQGVFQFTQLQPLPSSHKQCWMRVSKIFFEFQLCMGWGGGRTARKFQKECAVLRGNREMTEKYEYCSTVQRTFVQDGRFNSSLFTILKFKSHHQAQHQVGHCYQTKETWKGEYYISLQQDFNYLQYCATYNINTNKFILA